MRIGGMDGIFVAYHNTARIFGFQYFSRQDMDDRLFGGSVQGDRVFQKCVKCMEEILSEVTLCFPGLSVDCVFETSPQENALRIYVEPVEWDKPGEPPVVELLVTATNYMNGNRVMGPMNFGIHSDDCKHLLSKFCRMVIETIQGVFFSTLRDPPRHLRGLAHPSGNKRTPYLIERTISYFGYPKDSLQRKWLSDGSRPTTRLRGERISKKTSPLLTTKRNLHHWLSSLKNEASRQSLSQPFGSWRTKAKSIWQN